MERESSPWSSPRQSSRRYSRHSTPSTDLRQILIRKESSERISPGASEHGSSEHRSGERRSYEHKSREHDWHDMKKTTSFRLS
jgi:hypothetical protein